ncbi:hypothetical protein [Subtercola endophyticus]|uniref:hypothetical protein n=1 Tax=Subtercola endophyticus TaxID=2895559 RepID=UPI001E659B3F|nr:hypothetical protein [Subtercola endophyticus]UFS57752.1 hypothetical protein LQ955_11905 [Subtercola endophyticus]
MKSAISNFAPWRKAGIEALIALGCGVVALLIALYVLKINPSQLGERWGSGGNDQVLHYDIFSSALNTFPFLPNHNLGFPNAQNLFFAPLFDPWSALFVLIFSPVLPSGIWALNVYSLVGFIGTGFTAYFFFRALRVRRAIAIFFAIVFATVPYHFVQLLYGHPFLANYWAVPLIGILVLMVAGDTTNPFAGWVSRSRSVAQRRWRVWLPIVVITLLVALTQSYYFIFAAIVVGGTWAVKAVLELVRSRSRREFVRTMLWPTVTTGMLVVFIGAQLAVLSLNWGDRYAKYFGARLPLESELYGGKIMNLLLPAPSTGFAKLAQWAQIYQSQSPTSPSSENPSTAIVTGLAFAIVLVVIVVRLLRGSVVTGLRKPTVVTRFIDDDRIGALVVAFVVAFLFFLVAGLGALLAWAVSPEIRTWSRMSIVLSLLALGVLAVLIDMITKKVWLRIVILVVLGLVAVVDQIVGPRKAFDIQITDDSDLKSFVSQIEGAVPENCGIVQLPLKGFPETGNLGQMGDYDEGLFYDFAGDSSLRWSYGSVVGTNANSFWSDDDAPAAFAADVKASGACAILVDTYAFTESPGYWQAFVGSVADPNAPTLVSGDKDRRYELFVLKN